MPTTSGSATSQRLLSLLSLLQARRDWPGPLLAERLQVTPRTVRRDVERLRELGYTVNAVKGPDGGYRLDASAQLPPLLFDDEQAVVLVLALRSAAAVGAGLEEAAERALRTVRQVLPPRLAARVDALATATATVAPPDEPSADPAVLLAVAAAIRDRQELRFDYRSPGAPDAERAPGPARRAQPHHLLARAGRWYVLAWDPAREDWRTYRADRLTPRVPGGPHFTARTVPGGDPAAFLAARFKGSSGADSWPCEGDVVLGREAAYVAAYARDGVVEALGPDRTRLRLGAWSWAGLAAELARFDADVEVVGPEELRRAFADLAARAARAAASPG